MDILLLNGKSYVAYEDYKKVESELVKVQRTAESFLEKLTKVEISRMNAGNMSVLIPKQ